TRRRFPGSIVKLETFRIESEIECGRDENEERQECNGIDEQQPSGRNARSLRAHRVQGRALGPEPVESSYCPLAPQSLTSACILPISEFRPVPGPPPAPRTDRMNVLDASSGNVATLRQKLPQIRS